jgi:alkanesulfonate monooxygenase SsuD/methylene tetrahydromethanopterin reductase-like flavin-dependent oxidoreductase (luciferase family)
LLRGDGPASYEPKLAEVLEHLAVQPVGAGALPEATPPEVWVMGSGPGGAYAAAQHGLPFALAQFVHDTPKPQVADLYREHFRPAASSVARFCLSVSVACADDRADARALGALIGWLQSTEHHTYTAIHRAMPSWSELRTLSAQPDRKSVATLIGTPAEVEEQLGELIAAYRPDELAVTTACPPMDLRVRTFDLVRRMCGAG